MSTSETSEKEENVEEEDEKEVSENPPSDEEDDCEGFFLEPVASNMNMAEKIAEANKKLFEEEEEEENRPRKVKFDDNIVNFEPIYYSDDDYAESAGNSVISEEDSEIKPNEVSAETAVTVESGDVSDVKSEDEGKQSDTEEIPEEIIPSDFELIDRCEKFVLVLVPKEQNSSCESIIGEEIAEETEEKEPESVKVKLPRPKSAKKCCDVSKISPNLNYTSNADRRSWRTTRTPLLKARKSEGSKKKSSLTGEVRVEMKGRLKKVNIGDLENVQPETLRCCDRPKSSLVGVKSLGERKRPKTAPMRRTCCVIKTELPNYNGLRSEYGLSAEQLKQRKQETLKIVKEKKEAVMKERQEELRKRERNEEMFQRWLSNKTKKPTEKKMTRMTDTLTRSDVYIQTHAVYATKRSVPYAVDYNVNKRVKQKKILMEKFFDKVKPYSKRSFCIRLGG